MREQTETHPKKKTTQKNKTIYILFMILVLKENQEYINKDEKINKQLYNLLKLM